MKSKKKTQPKRKTYRQALEEIAMLRRTLGGGNESKAITIARDILEINGEDFEEYRNRKPDGIDTLLEKSTSEGIAIKFLQDVHDFCFEVEARMFPDDLETREQFIANVKSLLSEFGDLVKSDIKLTPKRLRNMAVIFTGMGLSLSACNENIR